MASLHRSKAVIELGKRIAAQLEDNGDIASAWLAHLLAERIEAARTAAPGEKAVEEEACTGLILELWRNQRALRGRNPLIELEPILRTLASLDTERTAFRYYPAVLRAADGAQVPEPVERCLKLATGIDYTARVLIKMALGEAVANLTGNSQDWIALARAAAIEEPVEGLVIRLLKRGEEGAPDSEGFSEVRRDKIRQLEAFIQIATQVLRDLSDQGVDDL